MLSRRPNSPSNVDTAATRLGWVSWSGLAQAPTYTPVRGAATGPDSNGPVEVAMARGWGKAVGAALGVGCGLGRTLSGTPQVVSTSSAVSASTSVRPAIAIRLTGSPSGWRRAGWRYGRATRARRGTPRPPA